MNKPVVLVVEDQALIGLSIEAFLAEAGYTVAGPFASNKEALGWLDHGKPAAAVLDLGLKDGLSTRLGEELRRRGVGFLVYSGHAQRPDLAPELHDVPWLRKPVPREDLLRAVNALIA
ncbi:response regulator [Salinarimonas soli]|uniref:Response regulator n=1 Tax=Salinarimonas soli TaxID=1638099 RepID=A0A5B2VG56_9HYPH|nr:response regulator [Salinarimonas soli]KAA2237875.1 response regulator [Salinarimonas soli]